MHEESLDNNLKIDILSKTIISNWIMLTQQTNNSSIKFCVKNHIAIQKQNATNINRQTM